MPERSCCLNGALREGFREKVTSERSVEMNEQPYMGHQCPPHENQGLPHQLPGVRKATVREPFLWLVLSAPHPVVLQGH